MSAFPGGFLGGNYCYGGYGFPIGTTAIAPQVSEDKKAVVKPEIPRPMANLSTMGGWGSWGIGGGSFGGYDKAPPLSPMLLWQMRSYEVIRLAWAITVRPILASPRTIEIWPKWKDDAKTKEIAEAATQWVLPAVEAGMEPGFECLQLGWWIQEIVWDRSEGVTYPSLLRTILPWEAQIYRDDYRQFSGFQIGTEFRDARYALLTVHNAHIDPIFGEARNNWCRQSWWRAVQSEENADKTERKAAGKQMLIQSPQGWQPVGPNGQPIPKGAYQQILANAAVTNDAISVDSMYFSQDSIEKDPKLAEVPVVKIDQLDWGDIAPAIAAHCQRMDGLNNKIMMAWMRPTREAMEGQNGTKAEAGTHGQIGVTDSEQVAATQLKQMDAQLLNRFIATNYGPEYVGRLYAKQQPLSDPQQQFLQDIYKAIVSNKTPDPTMMAQIDPRALADRVEIPILAEEEVAEKVAQQKQDEQDQSDAKNAAMAQGRENSPKPANGTKPRMALSASVAEGLARYLDLDEPLALEGTETLTGGVWRTINGARVYMKDGVAIAGPRHLIGKAHEDIAGHGKAPEKDKPGYHAIERDAKGDYVGTRGEDGNITHVQEHADRLQKTKAQPGHTDVYLSKDPNAKAPVVGTDSKGRVQAPRSEAAPAEAKKQKFGRNEEFDKALPQIRERLKADLHGDHSEEAAVLSLIDKTGFRIGGDEDTGAAVKAYGASTLNNSHVKIEGDKVEFNFTGKKGVQQSHVLHDPELARMLAPRVAKGGNLFNTNDAKTGKYLKEIGGNDAFKNKDFRTAVATETARKTIQSMPVPTNIAELKKARATVAETVSRRLGNNPSEAQKSYINPKVYNKWHATAANLEQAKLITQHAQSMGMSEAEAAKDWIGKNAASYREKFNKAIK